MVAFAGNSLLCRGALAVEGLDAASFTALRLVSGAAVLFALARIRGADNVAHGSWRGALALLGYALAFSVAYRTLDAGSGALILFASVQLTMMGVALARGERPRPVEWLGYLLAAGGLVGLLWPHASAPDLLGAAGMAIAGVCWGVYTLLGRHAAQPLFATAGNFVRAAPLALAAWLLALASNLAAAPSGWTGSGVALALASGVLASALGYAVWYRALRDLRISTAAVAQLSVPVIAMVGGVLLLREPLTLKGTVCGALTLAGIAVAILGKHRPTSKSRP